MGLVSAMTQIIESNVQNETDAELIMKATRKLLSEVELHNAKRNLKITRNIKTGGE